MRLRHFIPAPTNANHGRYRLVMQSDDTYHVIYNKKIGGGPLGPNPLSFIGRGLIEKGAWIQVRACVAKRSVGR